MLRATTMVVRDQIVSNVGLPSRDRYNLFVNNACDEMKLGGDLERSKIWALLASAEATFLAGE